MRPIAVLPAEAAARAAPLLRAAGWTEARARDDRGTEPAEALAKILRRGDPALYLPEGADPGRAPRRILVVHEGTRGDRAGMDAADEAAVATGAEILVLHVPPADPSSAPGALSYRIADHGIYDWAEWQAEFMRRFCRCSPGVRVSVRVSSAATPLQDQVREARADLVVVSTTGQLDATGGDVVDELLGGVTPVLVVPSVGRDRTARAAAERGQLR